MSDSFDKQVYANLNQKNTDELLEIWQVNDRVEWTDVAFQAIKEILINRGCIIPPQQQPIFEHPNDKKESKSSELTAVFYNPNNVLRLDTWLNRAAIITIIGTIISYFINFSRTRDIIWIFLGGNIEIKGLVSFISFIVVLILIGFQSILIYFPLRALGKILKIFMEMEFNSRRVMNDSEET